MLHSSDLNSDRVEVILSYCTTGHFVRLPETVFVANLPTGDMVYEISLVGQSGAVPLLAIVQRRGYGGILAAQVFDQEFKLSEVAEIVNELIRRSLWPVS